MEGVAHVLDVTDVEHELGTLRFEGREHASPGSDPIRTHHAGTTPDELEEAVLGRCWNAALDDLREQLEAGPL